MLWSIIVNFDQSFLEVWNKIHPENDRKQKILANSGIVDPQIKQIPPTAPASRIKPFEAT